MTPQKTCPRCGGQAGAHYAACVFTNLIQRWLGPEYPLHPPQDTGREHTELRNEIRGILDPLLVANTEEVIGAVGRAIAEYTAPLRKDLDALMDTVTHPSEAPKPDVVIEREKSGAPPAPEPPREEQPATAPPPRKGATTEVMSRAREAARAQMKADRDRYAPVIKKIVDEQTEPHPDGWVAARDVLTAAQQIDPSVTIRHVGMVLTELGYKKRQLRLENGTAPMHYQGIRWKVTTEPPIDQQMEQRRAAEAAAHAELAQANPAPKQRYRYDGPRPGKEIPPDYKELLEPLWSIPGWSYAPRNENGGGKPRVRNPEGTQYVLANTPSDVRGIRNVRAALRRLGAPL